MSESEATKWITQWIYDYANDGYLVEMLRKKLTDEQVKYVLEILDDTCKECYSQAPCACWNDD